MDGNICYLNTDLDLVSTDDLGPLAAALQAKGMTPLRVTRGDDRLWYSTFEMDKGYSEPEPNIGAMVKAVESLREPLLSAWSHCSLREFNIGYDCGTEPWAFTQGLSSELLSRIGAIGASLRVTIYPDRPVRKLRIKKQETNVAKTKLKRDAKREERIDMEIVVDCHDEDERMVGWCTYLTDQLQFPFKATCVAERSISPLKLKDEVEVIGVPEDECNAEMFVLIRRGEDTLGVPLAQLKPKRGIDALTKQAVEDWHYWVAMGYQF